MRVAILAALFLAWSGAAANESLDHTARTLDHYGYCVFGRVVKRMEVAAAIGDVEAHASGGFEDLPVEAVVIRKALVVR